MARLRRGSPTGPEAGAGAAAWVNDENQALLTDLYELTMLQAYWKQGMNGEAVFSLFVRRMPPARNYLLACGLADALRYLETLRFGAEALDRLGRLDLFSDDFLRWLGELRFRGDVFAIPEGTPVFAGEPLLEVRAALPEAQIAETFVMNQVHHQTVVASKAVRVVEAAAGRPVVDFGLRRMHGTDAGVKAARAFHVAGVEGTSNVLAGALYGIPLRGTMAHSYVQAHESEIVAFRDFARLYPGTILLVDTYDTLGGVKKVIELAVDPESDVSVGGIRLDSGDLGRLALESRALLDEAGLTEVRIFASGGLDEHEIRALLAAGAPIDAFGVGTRMGVSRDVPALDIAYKLTSYAGRGRLKLSPGKGILPGRKQVFRVEEEGRAVRDILALADEAGPGRPLIRQVMKDGARTAGGKEPLAEARARARREIDRLPERLRALAPAESAYPVWVSDELEAYRRSIAEHVTG